MDLGQETIARGTWSSGKVLVTLSFLFGLLFAVFVSPVQFTRGGADEPTINMFGAPLANPSAVSPMGMSCPRQKPVSVSAMQEALTKHGIPQSPLTKYALTKFAATRDPSMAAQVQEEFSRLDPATQQELKQLSKDVIVRAESMKAEEMAGAIAPLGFWDPFGYSKSFGDGIGALRNVELKHGRVCMLATLGIIVSEVFHPIFDGWKDGPFVSAAASHFTPTAALNFWPAFVTMCGIIDLGTELTKPADAAPGDYGFDPLGLKPKNAKELLELQNKELSNGRLAMLAASGIIAQELVTGKKIFR